MSASENVRWAHVAQEIGVGWRITQFDNFTGEVHGEVCGSPTLERGLLRVPVCWDRGGSQVRDVLEAPIVQRNIRYTDSSVLISGAAGAWFLIRP